VVFLDDSHWNAFAQLSPLLRRQGVRTVRITTEVRAASHIVSEFLFDRHSVVPRDSLSGALDAVLSSEYVVDVQFVEPFRGVMLDALDSLSPEVAEPVARRMALMDKLWASEHFASCEVRVPATALVEDASPETFAQGHGLPALVKGRVGCNGDQVHIAHDLPALRAAATTCAATSEPEGVFFEQYVHGQKLNYAVAVGPAGVEQELTYRVDEWRQPAGSAMVVETIDDPQLSAFGRRVVEAAGCTGLVNLDVIRDGEGRDWLIDFNPRAFGGLVSFRQAGLDIGEGYLRSIGQRDRPPTRRNPEAGVRINVFPTCTEEVADSGRVVRTASAFLRDARPYAGWLGLRYWAAEAGITAYAVGATRLGRRALGPGRGTSARAAH
jgi:hypothetical protein